MAVPSTILGVFAKLPQPGAVKTRLAAATSPQWAATLAEACILDTLTRLASVEARRILAFAPRQAETDFLRLSDNRFEVRPQVDGDLGQRMQAFFAEGLQLGAERIVLVGADSPTLPVSFVAEALDRLQDANVVLGPATDGGYYLVGCARRLPAIFAGIDWGSSAVFEQTVKLIEASHESLALLPPWYDVDNLDDCRMLRGHLAALRASGVDPKVPHVEAVLLSAPW